MNRPAGGVLKLEPSEAEALVIPSVLPFGSAELSRMDELVRARKLEEVLDLAPGDVLLLDKGLDEPVDLILHNETVFRGRPAQKDGQYAVLITERAADSHPDASRGRDAR